MYFLSERINSDDNSDADAGGGDHASKSLHVGAI